MRDANTRARPVSLNRCPALSVVRSRGVGRPDGRLVPRRPPGDTVARIDLEPTPGLTTPIAEAMVSLVLMDHLFRHRGQTGA